MKCRVRVKSRTSLERATRATRAMTLWSQQVSLYFCKGVKHDVHGTGAAQPHKGQQPALGGVPAQGGPAEDEVEGEVGAHDESGEEHENKGDGVVYSLKSAYLGQDAQRRQLGDGAGPRWSSPTGHGGFFVGMCVDEGRDAGLLNVSCPAATAASRAVLGSGYKFSDAPSSESRARPTDERPREAKRWVVTKRRERGGADARCCDRIMERRCWFVTVGAVVVGGTGEQSRKSFDGLCWSFLAGRC